MITETMAATEAMVVEPIIQISVACGHGRLKNPRMSDLELTDLSDLLESDSVREILGHLEYPIEIREAKTDEIVGEYVQHPEHAVLGTILEGELVGFIGLRFESRESAEIRHIVVRADLRGQGIGETLITAARRKYSLATVWAETDKDAVGFYRRCGFVVDSLGEKYPGVERFRCTLKRR